MDQEAIKSRISFAAAAAGAMAAMSAHAGAGTRIGYEFGLWLEAPRPDDIDPYATPELRARFDTFLRQQAREAVEKAIVKLANAIDDNDGSVCLYRGLHVAPEWLDGDISSRAIGLCWSWDYEFAIAHRAEAVDSEEPIEARIIATVPLDGIDWTTTVGIAAGEPYVTEEEREIRLLPDTFVAIAGIDTRPVDSSGGTSDFVPDPRFEGCWLVVRSGIAASGPSPV